MVHSIQLSVLAHYFISTYINAPILNTFLLVVLIALKTLPTFIIASGLSKVPSGQLLASLQNLKFLKVFY